MICKYETGPDNEYEAYWCEKYPYCDMSFERCDNEEKCYEEEDK